MAIWNLPRGTRYRIPLGVIAIMGTLFAGNAQAQLSLQQTLGVKVPGPVVLSPDGSLAAYVATEAQLPENRYRATLQVMPATGGAPRRLAEAERIVSVQWAADGAALFYVAKQDSSYRAWSVRLDTGAPRSLMRRAIEMVSGDEDMRYARVFEVSPDGRYALYLTRDRAAAENALRERHSNPILYTSEMGVSQLLSKQAWIFQPEAVPQLWLLDIETGRERRIWVAPVRSGKALFAVWFDWSPDGRHVAVIFNDAREDWITRGRLLIFETDTFTPREAQLQLGDTGGRSWTADSREIVFRSEGEITSRSQERYQHRLYRYSVSDGRLRRVDTPADESSVLAERIKKATDDWVHDCSGSLRHPRAICILESASTPPEVATYDLESAGSVSSRRVLTKLNADIAQAKLGEASPLQWRRANGDSGTSGLILPVDYVAGKRYPLVVMLYNQYQAGRYSANVSFTSYAPQVFAGHGYVVLLQNTPSNEFAYEAGDFDTALARHPEGVAQSLRAMLDDLITRGIVDSPRMGIMGWSWGQFYATYVLTHYPEWFKAGAAGDGGNHQPMWYWTHSAHSRAQEDQFFGGGPYGRYAHRWRRVSPILNVHKLEAPLLLEYSGMMLHGVEFQGAALDQGRQVELVVYPDEEHVFERPSNRYASMQRHFDWFNFWLLGEEDRDPGRAAQYERWREMRRQLPTGSASSGAHCGAANTCDQ